MHAKAQSVVLQCAQFSTNTKLLHNQSVKHVLKYLKGTTIQGLIMKTDPKKGTECYVDPNFY